MEDMRLKTTRELAEMLGVDSQDDYKMSFQFIIGNVSPTIRPKIQAAIELYKRSQEDSDEESILDNPDAVVAIVRPMLSDLEHEECWALMLNGKFKLIRKVMISSGATSSCTLDIAGIARHALMTGAACVILAHNHPGGDPTPSKSDIECTAKLTKSLKLLGIQMVDHIVVANGGNAYSFADERIISRKK